MFALVNHAPIIFLVGDVQLDIFTDCVILVKSRTWLYVSTHCSKESNHESFCFGIEINRNGYASKLLVTIISVLDKCDLIVVIGAVTFCGELFFQSLDMTFIP